MLRSILALISRKVRRTIHHLGGFWNLWYLSEQHQRQGASLHERLDQLAETISRPQAQDGIAARTLGAEIDRLDGYLVYHVGTLSGQIDALTSRVQANQEHLRGAIEAKLAIAETRIDRLEA